MFPSTTVIRHLPVLEILKILRCISLSGYEYASISNTSHICMYVGMILLVAWNYLRQWTLEPMPRRTSYRGLCWPFHPSWEICSGCGTNVSCTTIFQTRPGLPRGSLGEQSHTEPSRSIRPDTMVLVLLSSFDFRPAFRNDNGSTQAMSTIKIISERSGLGGKLYCFLQPRNSNDGQEC